MLLTTLGKGKVERSIGVVTQGFWPGVAFSDLDDLNAQALGWCERLNGRVHRTTHERPAARLTAEALRPLPAPAAWARFAAEERQVSWDGFVSFDGVLYGLPSAVAVAGGTVQVRDEGTMLAIWHQGRPLAQMPKQARSGTIVLHPEQFRHMPPAAALRRQRQPLAHQLAAPVVAQRAPTQNDALCGVESWT